MKPAELARSTVEKFIKERQIIKPPQRLFNVDVNKAGTFVSIKTGTGDLRGCIGTIFPTKSCIIDEIIHNSIAAATRDPRFEEIKRYELNNLKYSVDVLFPPEPIKNVEELNPKTYGIIVAAQSGRQALLLPDLEGVDTVDDQIQICKRKAGIVPSEPVAIRKFKVERYAE